MKGFILYEGPSELDGKPIVCIVTDPDQSRLNAKTQRVIQTYIFRADVSPLDALKGGEDISVCGDCMHRPGPDGRSCYVQLWGGPRNVWLAYSEGKKYKWISPEDSWLLLDKEIVRLGTYGDPAAVPIVVWRKVLRSAKAVIGYTHQWRAPKFFQLQQWCMASCDSIGDYNAAKMTGWRTFRVRSAQSDRKLSSEVVCPASKEAGYKSNCAECRACGGHGAKANCDIVIAAHGDKGKVNAFKRKALEEA